MICNSVANDISMQAMAIAACVCAALTISKLNSSLFTGDDGEDTSVGVGLSDSSLPNEDTRTQTIVSCGFLLAISILVVAIQFTYIVIDAAFNLEVTKQYSTIIRIVVSLQSVNYFTKSYSSRFLYRVA